MDQYVHESIPDLLPREKLITRGAESLSDIELLSVIIGSGYRGRSVAAIAKSLEELLSTSSRTPDIEELTAVPGIGPAKATLLSATIELGHRIFIPRGTRIHTPLEVFAIIKHFADRVQEHFLVVTLNGAHEVIRKHVVSVGLVNRTMIHPREVFAPAIADRSAAIVAAHNHPSGNVEPSAEDREVTVRLRRAGEIVGIRLLDHIVFGPTTFYSFAENEPWTSEIESENVAGGDD